MATVNRTRIWQLDAFTSQRFCGNPAAVMPLDRFPPDAVMQQIAAENNLSETAFLVAEGGDYRLRWFTPDVEVPLCGHATLASAAVVMERLEPERREVVFHTASGALQARRSADGYVLNFPARPCERIAAPPTFCAALGAEPVEVHADAYNYLALFENAAAIRQLDPNFEAVARLDRGGLIVTAPGDAPYDFVSRYFTPEKGIPEDPVTGSAHCALTPFWSKRLNKTKLRAPQASKRGGDLNCRLLGDRVELEGRCVFFLEGEVEF